MTKEPIPLATQLASMRAAAEAHTGRCWLTRALEAMIMAALARIFARLENLVRLWQAHHVAQRGINVDSGDGIGRDNAGAPSWRAQDERDAHGRLVESEILAHEPVAAHGVAMVGGEDDYGIAIEIQFP